jgi:hypothetical protein
MYKPDEQLAAEINRRPPTTEPIMADVSWSPFDRF